MEKVKISKIELIVNDKKIELTINEAMELKELLNKTFEKEVIITNPIQYYPVYPWWRELKHYYQWTTSCNSDGSLTHSNTARV